MKKLIAVSLAAIFAGFLFSAQSNAQMMQGQQKSQKKQSGMMGQGMQGGMMGGMMKGGMMGGQMHRGFDFYLGKANRLGLTQAQVKQLRNMKFAFAKANTQRKAALQVAKLDLQQLKTADKVDAKKVEAKIREIQSLKADMEIALFRAKMKAKSTLTDEQRSKLANMSCSGGGKMHSGGKMGQGGKMGSGKMMNKSQQPGDASQHEQHHKNN